MLIKDGQIVQSHREKEITERTRQQTKAALEDRIQSEGRSIGTDAGMDVTDEHARWGRRMDVKEVMAMLHTMNPKLVFEESKVLNTIMGIYIPEWTMDAATLGWQYNKRYVMAMENGVMPEFTIMFESVIPNFPDPNDMTNGGTRPLKTFKAMKRGWRAVLVTLLWEKLITEEQIRKYFKVQDGQESERWRNETGQGPLNQVVIETETEIKEGKGKGNGDTGSEQNSTGTEYIDNTRSGPRSGYGHGYGLGTTRSAANNLAD